MFRFVIVTTICCLFAGYQEANGQCSTHQTSAGTSAAVANLDLHNVMCPAGKLLNRFKLFRPTSVTMAYQYTCCTPGESYDCYQRTTAVSAAGNVNLLDRQDVDCGNGYLMYSHQFENWGGGYRYRFHCCVASPENCDTHYTAWGHDGVGNVVYLDQHNVACPASRILKQFKLETSGIYMRYRYICCDAAVACPNPYDRFERVQTCDARSSSISLTCTYERRVGTIRTNTQSEGTSISQETSKTLQQSFASITVSQTTQYDWRYETSDTYMAERTVTMSFECPPGTLCYLDQAVGLCGNNNYRVRSTYFKLSTQ